MAIDSVSALGKKYELLKVSGVALKVEEYSSTSTSVNTSYVTGAPNVYGSSSVSYSTKILFRYGDSHREDIILYLDGRYSIMDGQDISVFFVDGQPYHIINENTGMGMRVSEGEVYLGKSIPSIPILSFIYPFPLLAGLFALLFAVVVYVGAGWPIETFAPDAFKGWSTNFLWERGLISSKTHYQHELTGLFLTPLLVLGFSLAYIWYAWMAFRRGFARSKLWGQMLEFKNKNI